MHVFTKRLDVSVVF